MYCIQNLTHVKVQTQYQQNVLKLLKVKLHMHKIDPCNCYIIYDVIMVGFMSGQHFKSCSW